MSVATSTAIAIAAGAAAAGGIGSAVIGSKAAGKASGVQANAATYTADLQKQAADQSLAFEKEQFDTQQKNLAPWLQAGTGAVGQLSSLLQLGGGLSQQWQGHFQAPTGATEQNDPGYQFRLSEGMKALQRSASARGGLLSGGTAKALTRYGQDYASNEYGNVYGRAFDQYKNNFNEFQIGQNNQYNRLAGLSGVGQTAANTLATSGSQAAGNVSNILLGSAAQQGNAYQNAAAARASGYINSANAYGGAFNGITNNLTTLALLKQLGGVGGGAGQGNPAAFSNPNGWASLTGW